MTQTRQKVLIVDDGPPNIELLHDALGGQYEVFAATDGLQALAQAAQVLPDIILLDVMMPAMDGFEVCRCLKANPKTRDIPVVFVTAMGDGDAETRGLGVGAIDYVAKPVNPVALRARVRNHLELKRHRDLLARLSAVDGLTGLANRRRFDEALDAEWRRGLRNGASLALAMIDIDHFKAYNDRHGHLAGDDCLRQVAAVLPQCLHRAGDLAARYGGEEFVVLLPDTDVEGARLIAEQMRSAVAALGVSHPDSPTAAVITASVGVAAAVLAAPDAAELLQTADRMLYAAKQRGRNCVVASPGEEATVQRPIAPATSHPAAASPCPLERAAG